MIPIYIIYSCYDSYVKGIYTSLEAAKKHANLAFEPRDKIFRAALDSEFDYDYYSDVDIIEENRKWDRKRK